MLTSVHFSGWGCGRAKLGMKGFGQGAVGSIGILETKGDTKMQTHWTALRRRTFKTWSTLMALGAALSVHAAAPVYHLQEIARLEDLEVRQPMAINTKGHVVGHAYSTERGFVCFKYADGVTTELPDSQNCGCVGINDDGAVVGHDSAHAYLWAPDGKRQQIPWMIMACGINAAGHVSGIVQTDGWHSRAALFADGELHDLGLLDGHSTFSQAWGLNDKDVVVGTGDGRHGHVGVRWRGERSREISADAATTAEAINEHGHIVGTTGPDVDHYGSYFMDEAGVHAVPMLPDMARMKPRSLNERDEFVGTMHSTRTGDELGFYARRGRAYRLLRLLDDESRGVVSEVTNAMSINDAGQIVGAAMSGGTVYPYIATPVAPAP
jgi:probable HAF family extracellular repeat protein